MQTAIYFFVALYIAWIWVDYYRLIDVYEREDLKYLVGAFLIGSTSVFVVWGYHLIIPKSLTLEENGTFINDLILSIAQIGMLEELAKLVPFLIFYRLFKNEFDEPIDFLAYACIGALGFAAVENTLYFNSYGGTLIVSRGLLACVLHMACTALVVYGYILYKYHPKKYGIWIMPLFFVIGSLLHGLYDFVLIYAPLKAYGYGFAVVLFLLGITLFSIVLNNSLNNSEFFTYKKFVNTSKLSKWLIGYYVVLAVIQVGVITYESDLYGALGYLVYEMLTIAFVVAIVVLRMSRFQHKKHHWAPFSISLPVSFMHVNREGARSWIKVKGPSHIDTVVRSNFEDYFYIAPISSNQSFWKKEQLAYMQEMFIGEDDVTLYVIRVYESDQNSPYSLQIMTPKEKGVNYMSGNLPVISILDIDNMEDMDQEQFEPQNARFKYFMMMKPYHS